MAVGSRAAGAGSFASSCMRSAVPRPSHPAVCLQAGPQHWQRRGMGHWRSGSWVAKRVSPAVWSPPGSILFQGDSAAAPWFLSFSQQRTTSTSSSDGREKQSNEKPKREPIDTTTTLDIHNKVRNVERKIHEHVDQLEKNGVVLQSQLSPEQADAAVEAASAVTPELRRGDAPVFQDATSPVTFSGPEHALRLEDPQAIPDNASANKDVIVRSHTTTGQVLWPATQEDIEILSQSKLLYPAPYEVEGSVIIRLVRLSDPVTSPVARVVRNRQFGIRGNEKWKLLAMGVVFSSLVYVLGFWQLYRMEWKRKLIEMRRTRLAMPRLCVNSSPFLWRDKVQDYVYRVVDIRGIFDNSREMHVGPRPGTDADGNTVSGYVCVTPLRLEDGSTILVNRGHLAANFVDRATRPEVPRWVRVRGVLEEGEIANMVGNYARLKNRPDRNQFQYVVAHELAENAGARNHDECSQAIITATDILFEDDFQAGVRRQQSVFTMKHKEDYMVFWADEHTHFNYACQWFGMGTLTMAMTLYKFIEVTRWRY